MNQGWKIATWGGAKKATVEIMMLFIEAEMTERIKFVDKAWGNHSMWVH